MIRATAVLFVLASILLTYPSSTQGYVVSSSGLPRHKQLAWLNKLTENICSTAPGQLSNEMLDSANDLIYAWAQLDSKDCALKVESLVKRVCDERRAGNLVATTTLSDYNLLLDGWVRSRAGTAAAERCEQILVEMQEHSEIVPDLESFKSVLVAWRLSKDRDAAVRAQRVLEYMAYLHTSGLNEFARPDRDCYNLVLQLWSRSGRKDAATQAEQLVLAMEKLHLTSRDMDVKPNTSSMNAVLAAWSKSENDEAAKHMLDILHFMESHAKLGDTSIEPDMVSYSTCISGLARQEGHAKTAEELLNQLEAAGQSESSKLTPDTILYNSVISCWARMTNPGAYRKARSVLDRQMNHHYDLGEKSQCKPDVYGFTSVLASCAMEPKERYKAFQVALATFQQLRHSEAFGSPNHVTYGTMLKCIARLLPRSNPLRRKWTKIVMAQCIEDGCVGDMVMSRFRQAATSDLFREIMGDVDKKNLPKSWTRNVHEKRECRKKKRRVEM